MSIKITYRRREAESGIAADLKELDEFIQSHHSQGRKVSVNNWEDFRMNFAKWKKRHKVGYSDQ